MIDISIIIPTYNRKALLQAAVQSALAIQKYSVEVIVIDDGSKDGTQSLDWEDDRIQFISQQHLGGNVARNKGLSLAKGNYIKFLDDDDFLIPEGVEAQISYLEQTGYDVCYGNWYVQIEQDNEKKIILEQKYQVHDPITSLLSLWSCAPFAYLVRKKTVEGIRWDEKLEGFQDFDFFLKVAEQVKTFHFIDQTIGYYRVHTQGNVMSKSPLDRAHNLIKLLNSAFERYKTTGILNRSTEKALAQGYYAAIRPLYQWDRRAYKSVKDKIYQLYPGFKPSPRYNLIDQQLVPVMGIEGSEFVLHLRRRIKNIFTGYLNEINHKVESAKK